jgi:isoquinoline 1-oxidoreductase beta subunit
MLVSAASARWGVEASECRSERGEVVHSPTGRRVAYGSLVEAASKLKVPTDPRLKAPREFRLIGRPTPRLDAPRIVTGHARYGLDTRVPGLLYAAVERSPVIGGRVARWDASRARAVPGVRQVLEIPSGVAVVGSDTWTAQKGRAALDVVWEEGPNAGFDSGAFRTRLAEATGRPGRRSRRDGTGLDALASAARNLEAVYEYPF